MHRVVFEIGGFQIASYGLMVAIGMLVGVWVATVRARNLGENPAVILDLTIWVVVAGILGARIMYVFLEGWHDVLSRSLLDNLKLFARIRQGGLSFLGSLMLSIPVGLIYLKRKRLDVWKFADISAPSVAIGIAFARIGCFLNGCCFGLEWGHHVFCSVEFPVGSIPFDHYGTAVSLYPTQLMSSVNALVIFLILSVVFKYRRFDGQVFWLFLLLYSVFRFATDMFRGDSSATFFGGLFLGRFTLAQCACAIGFLLSAAMLVLMHRKARAHTRA